LLYDRIGHDKTNPCTVKPELAEKYHVNSIGLFGSVLRDDFTTASDIDIIVDFSKPIGIEFVSLADLIEKNFGKMLTLFPGTA
jgi:uncharacterized protein